MPGFFRYNIAEPHEYLLITGAGIEDVRIAKKALVMPWQKCSRISIAPFDFSLNLQAMTIEKLQFALPAVFTIGPDNEMESLKKYALLLSGNPDEPSRQRGDTIMPAKRNHVQDIVKGIIEGETRVIVSGMTMEEIFKERQIFKQKVIDNVQNELNQFGLRIYNANVKELQDTPGSEYFAFLSRKAHEGASNQARIDVSEARMRGEIGEAEKRGRTKQEISKIDAETAVLETKRKSEKASADAELTNRQTELDMHIKLAQIKARRQAEAKDAELQKDVETKKADTELERLRAIDVTKSKIARETAQQKADAAYYSETKAADASQYSQKQNAEAIYLRQLKEAEASYQCQLKETDAQQYSQNKATETTFQRQLKESDALQYSQNQKTEAAFQRQLKEADAAFYMKKKEAEGISAVAESYRGLADVLGGPQGLLQYLMLKDNTYEKLALANAKAVNGLQPKITVWNTGTEGNADAGAPIRNLLRSLPPLLSTINDQTGIKPPGWLAGMPDDRAVTSKPRQTKETGLNGLH